MSTLNVDLTEAEMRALRDLAENEALALEPADVVRRWVLEKLGSLPLLYDGAAATPAVDDGREQLRRHYQPDDVEILFVGESPPAGRSFFYQADSNLFRAVREACIEAYGPLPEADAFLYWFKEQRFWLWDLSIQPVNRMSGRPRKDIVDQGALPLARLIRDIGPDFVVAIKESIAPTIRAAADLARMPQARVVVLPFPLYQWRRQFVDELATFLRPAAASASRLKQSGGEGRSDALPERDPSLGKRPLALHEAIVSVLEQAGAPMSSRETANAIARDGLYRRGDGKSPPASQVAARVRKYPKLFIVAPGGISLRRS